MAEVVYKNLEQMVSEVQELEQREIFTKEELRIATKRRTEFEYKLQKKIMNKQDVLNYIEYEIKFEKLTKRRMKKLKMNPISSATINIQRRILTLFDKVLMKFEGDLDIWLQYINFCKKNKSKKTLSKIFPKMLQKHPHNTDVWLLAAKYEMEDESNIENARSLLQKGLRQNKESSILWLEYFKMELLHVRKIKKRKETLGIDGIDLKENEEGEPKEIEAFLRSKTAEIVYNNAIKQITDDFEFRMKFIEICKDFDDTENLIKCIFQSIECDFKGSKRLFEVILKKNTSFKRTAIVSDDIWKSKELEIINECQALLQENNTSIMWESFLNIMGELLQMSKTTSQTNRRLDCIKQIIEKAEEMGMISCNMALFWLDIVVEVVEEPLPIVEKYRKTFPQNVPIALKYLALKAETIDEWDELRSLFQVALNQFNNKEGLPIWQLYVDIASSLEDKEGCQNVFEEACFYPIKEISHHFLTRFLLWLEEEHGIEKARQFYQKVIKERVPIEFLQHCLQIESRLSEVDLKRLRLLHETIVGHYGDNNADVWLSYIESEKKFNCTDIESASRLYMRAKNTLQGASNDEFLVKHSQMLTSQRNQ